MNKLLLIALFALGTTFVSAQDAFKIDTTYCQSSDAFWEAQEQWVKKYNYEEYCIKMNHACKRFMKIHKDDKEGLNFLNLVHYYIDPKLTMELYDIAGDFIKNNEQIKKVYPSWQTKQATAVGKKFTDFTVEYDGKTSKLSDFVGKGKYTLVDFWASWCGPCRQAIPYIKAVAASHSKDSLTVVGVATWDKPADTQKAIENLGITYPQILNAQKIGSDAYSIVGIPEIILFDPQGKILARGLTDELISKAIDWYLNPNNKNTFIEYEVPARYSKGNEQLKELIASRLQYPKASKKNKVEGKSVISFVIDEKGNASNFKVSRSLNEECDAEAIRVLKTISGWTPAKVLNEPIKTTYVYPVEFKL